MNTKTRFKRAGKRWRSREVLVSRTLHAGRQRIRISVSDIHIELSKEQTIGLINNLADLLEGNSHND